jgi:kinase
MATTHYLLLLVFLPFLLLRVSAQSQQKIDEAQLLLQIKSNPPVLAAWNISAAACTADGRTYRCDTVGRVSSLFLASINVSGPFPDAVGGLSGLIP